MSHDYQDVIDTVDQRLLEWIGKLASRTKVLLASPGDMPGKQGVSLYLLELISNPPLRGVHRPPLSLSLRYLITTWLEDAAKSDRLLGELFSGLQSAFSSELYTGFSRGSWRHQFQHPGAVLSLISGVELRLIRLLVTDHPKTILRSRCPRPRSAHAWLLP